VPATDRRYEFSMSGRRINATKSRGPCRVLAKYFSIARRWDFGTTKLQASRGWSGDLSYKRTSTGLISIQPTTVGAQIRSSFNGLYSTTEVIRIPKFSVAEDLF